MQPHPQVPWVQMQAVAHGAWACRCTVCGAVATLTEHDSKRFLQAHAAHQGAAPTHYGAGDLVAKATSALGIEPCSPCEERRRQLNQLWPRAWRR